MSDILCITNRRLCSNFLGQLSRIADAHPAAIVLREKDLSELEYEQLAREALSICRRAGTPLILHSFPQVALELDVKAIHLPLPILRCLDEGTKAQFSTLGASCHSLEEALEAKALGCSYLTAGHIFATDCKKGLPPRGTAFLRDICQGVSLDVYGIGGISPDNVQQVYEAGARGACLMSGLMKSDNPAALLAKLERVSVP